MESLRRLVVREQVGAVARQVFVLDSVTENDKGVDAFARNRAGWSGYLLRERRLYRRTPGWMLIAVSFSEDQPCDGPFGGQPHLRACRMDCQLLFYCNLANR